MLTTQTNKETHCKCSQHNQIHFICSAFLFWLSCERVCCQIDESVFLICRCFFSICSAFLFWLCCEHLQRVRFAGVFSICSALSSLGHHATLCSPPGTSSCVETLGERHQRCPALNHMCNQSKLTARRQVR